MAIVSDQIDMITNTRTTPRASQFIDCNMPMTVKFVDIPSMKLLLSSILLHAECNGQGPDDGNRLAVQCTGFESAAPHCFQRGVLEAEGESFEDARVGDTAVPIDDGLDDHDPLDARLLGRL